MKNLIVIIVFNLLSLCIFAQQSSAIGFLGKRNTVSINYSFNVTPILSATHEVRGILGMQYLHAVRNKFALGFGYQNGKNSVDTEDLITSSFSSSESDKTIDFRVQDYKIILSFSQTFAPVGPFVNWNFGYRDYGNLAAQIELKNLNSACQRIKNLDGLKEDEYEIAFLYSEIEFGFHLQFTDRVFIKPSCSLMLPISRRLESDFIPSDFSDCSQSRRNITQHLVTAKHHDYVRINLGSGFLF